MSTVSNNGNEGANSNPAGAQGEEFVSKKSYEEVSKDMHKYKGTVKELQAKLNELETQVKSKEEEKLVEQRRFEDLYKQEKEAKERAESSLKQSHENFIKSVKMTALIKELGNIEPKYLTHAALGDIEVNDDGSLNSESVTKVANKFRQENPRLVPSSTAGNINDAAPNSDTVGPKTVNIENASRQDIKNALAEKRKQERGTRVN